MQAPRQAEEGEEEEGEVEGEREPPPRTKSSQYRGVIRRRSSARFEASIVMNRKNCRCGPLYMLGGIVL